jgi:hypothetical protein
MKLGAAAYDIAGYVVDSYYSLHDLYSTLTKVDRVDAGHVERYMSNGLRELARLGLITWTYEPNYGNTRGVRPPRFDERAFLQDWERCVRVNSLHCGVPDLNSPTMLIMGTDTLETDSDTLEVEPESM